MWKYIVASFLSCIGIVEIVLALHGGLREALLQSSPVRSERAEPPLLLFSGVSALFMGLGILLYGLLL